MTLSSFGNRYIKSKNFINKNVRMCKISYNIKITLMRETERITKRQTYGDIESLLTSKPYHIGSACGLAPLRPPPNPQVCHHANPTRPSDNSPYKFG